MDLNMLRQYMDFADQQHLFDAYKPSGSGFQPTIFNIPGMKADWAMQLMGNGPGGGGTANRMPDFFGGSQASSQGGYSPSAYVPPQQFQGRFQMPQAQQQPLTGQVNNYLAQMMGRR